MSVAIKTNMNQTSNTTRIAKNSFYLYIRMGILILISFYTSRVVLRSLGVVDFGIFNVVGGCVSMLGFIQGTMTGVMQRYFSYAIQRPDIYDMKRVYNASLKLLILLSIVILILTESIGLWFVLNKLTIPNDRMMAAVVVYQFSIFQAIIMLLGLPYISLIVSYEKMQAFAYISIFEAIAKLFIAYSLTILLYDKLCVYAILLFITQCFIRCVYVLYCKRKFGKMHFHFTKDFSLEKEMIGFTGWNTIQMGAEMVQIYGGNILLNIFFGPIVNAARGISMQVMGVVRNFSVNFLMAINPQIIKSYASEDSSLLFSLISRATRFGFYLMYAICLPVLLITDLLLKLWLGEIPTHSGMFVKLILISTIFLMILDPLKIAIGASGKIKRIQIVYSVVCFLNIPFAYLFLIMGYGENTIFIIQIISSIILYLFHIYYGYLILGLDLSNYFRIVMLPMISVFFTSTLSALILNEIKVEIVGSLFIAILSFVLVIVSSYSFGITHSEREYIRKTILNKLKKNL